MPTPFDVIVIGSGFGGAITARRLAEKGMRVLVLERGRRWEVDQYPRRPGDAWIFSHDHPALSQRLDGHALLQGHGGGAGGRRGRRVADLQQRRRRGHSGRLHRGLASGDHLRRAEALLRHGRPGDEPPGHSRRPADEALRPRPRGGAKPGLCRSLLEGAAGRQLFRRLELPARGPVQPEALPAVHECARAAPGDVHPPRELRHRL